MKASNNDDDGTSSTISASPSIAASPYWKPSVQPHVSSRSSSVYGASKGFSPFVAFCFTINYILGCGFLSIPWAFVQSGLVLSSILLIMAAVTSDVAKDYVLETMARAEVMLDDQMHWIKKTKDVSKGAKEGRRLLLVPPSKRRGEEEHLLLLQYQEDTDPASSTYDAVADNRAQSERDNNFHRSSSLPAFVSPEEEILEQGSHHHVHTKAKRAEGDKSSADATKNLVLPFAPPKPHDHLLSSKYVVGERKFEVNALCRVFLEKRGLRVYTLVISLYLCGALWAYVSVFSSAMATALPIVHDVHRSSTEVEGLNYLIYAIMFGGVVVPLSCLELEEQVPLQVALTGCRFLMFFLMLGTSYMCSEDQEEALMATGKGSTEFLEADNFRWSGLPKTLPILIFANIFHHSIPGLTSPVADKKKIGGVFSATNAFTTSAYLILGLTLGTTFGKSIHQSSNLNWNNFHAGTGELDEHGHVVDAAWWTQIVSLYIILFPAIDVVSAYPLNAITLGNNLFNAAYGKRIHEVENNRWLRTGYRLLASVPPIIFGIMVRQLGVITDYTGTTGFLIGLSFPAILYMASTATAKRKNYDEDTYYTRFGSKTVLARALFWFGISMMVAVFITLTFGKMLGLED